MQSRQRKAVTTFALCLAGCSSSESATIAVGGAAAPDSGAPSGSFRAAMIAFDSLPEIFAREVAAAESISLRRSRVTEIVFPKRGDSVLVDVTAYDEAQKQIERVNSFGVLQSRAGDTWSVRDSRTRRLVTVRLSENSWRRAPRGVYRLRTTGEVVGQPAYRVRIERYALPPGTGRVIGFQPAY